MYEQILEKLRRKPGLYEPSTSKFWDDEHISKGMLAAHLNPDLEAASRKLSFVKQSADWIANLSVPSLRPKLLDLGCGPGIYAELFAQKGFSVTGLDLSTRSIRYAKESAIKNNLTIEYQCKNYLSLDSLEEYDVITIIYCDFGVLSPKDRDLLLKKIHQALKPNGLFILDAHTPMHYKDRIESSSWSYSNGGFWSADPYVCLTSFYRYDSEHTYADQYVIIEKDSVNCYNIWNYAYTPDKLQSDLTRAGFPTVNFYQDVVGNAYSEDSITLCGVARK